jgi:peptidoglycan/xylan/chitin deacetylase (PgdA/CDA1 family)
MVFSPKQSLKILITDCLYFFGLTQQYLNRKVKQKAIILAYHRIVPKSMLDPTNQMPGMYVSEESFEMHMEWLKKNFDIVKLEKIIHQIQNQREWDKPQCAITFDDGWKDNYEYAFPILKRHNIPATIFLVGGDIENIKPICWYIIFEAIVQSDNLPEELTSDFAFYNNIFRSKINDPIEKARKIINILRELPYDKFNNVCDKFVKYFNDHMDYNEFRMKYETLSRRDVQEMSKYGIDFGYHSLNHFMLTRVTPELLNNEIIIPVNLSKDKSINFKPIFCYPDGNYDADIIDLLKKNHYIGAVSLRRGMNDIDTKCFEICRINIHEGIAKPLPLFVSHIASSSIK